MEERLRRLEEQVALLIQERDAAIEAERKAQEENAKMWAYYQAEEYKARHGELNSEGCRNA